MSGLPNLKRISEAATPPPWRPSEHAPRLDIVADNANVAILCDGGQTYDSITGNIALIAAAPEMARLLQECAEALTCLTDVDGWINDFGSDEFQAAAAVLARLAEFDRGLA